MPCSTDEDSPWLWSRIGDICWRVRLLLRTPSGLLRSSLCELQATPRSTCFHPVRVGSKRVWSRTRTLCLGVPGCMWGTLDSKPPFWSVFQGSFNTSVHDSHTRFTLIRVYLHTLLHVRRCLMMALGWRAPRTPTLDGRSSGRESRGIGAGGVPLRPLPPPPSSRAWW